MKILKVKIDNFGKLSNLQLSFDKALTVINEDNGWGKTTLTDFIKTMFYGISGDTKRSVAEKYRLRYNPWQGGVFGGSLEFEFKNKQYKVTRIFRETEKKDSFELLNLQNNKPLEYYPETNEKIIENGKLLGFYLLGLNEEAFNKTVFLSQNSKTHKIDSADINEKLNSLLGGEIDKYDYKKVISKVDAKINAYKRKSNTGDIYPLEVRKVEIEKQIESSIKERDQLNKNLEKINNLNESINKNTQKVEKIKEKIATIQKNSEVASLKKQISDAKIKIDETTKNLNEIKETFKNAEPKKDDIEKLTSAINRLEFEKQNKNLHTKLEQLENDLQKVEEFFNKKTPTASELSKLNENIAKYSILNNQNKNQSNNMSVNNNKKAPNKNIVTIMFLVLAVLLLVGGAITVVNQIIGLVMIVATLATFVLTYVLLNISAKNKNKTSNNTNLNIKDKDNTANLLKSEIINYFSFYYSNELISNNTFYSLYSDLYEKFNKYNNTHKLYNNAKLEVKTYDENLQKMQLEIESLLDDYNVDEIVNYNEVKAHINLQFEKFSAEKRLLTVRESEYNKLLTELNTKQKASNNLPTESLEQLQLNEKEIEDAIKDLEKEKTRLKTLNLSLENSFNQLPILETELHEITEVVKEKEHELMVLEHTKKFLEKAEDAVTSKYIAPIKEVFEEMSGQIISDGFSDVLINSDLDIKLKNYGINYEFDYYSTGYKDIVNLVLRLSLAKILFKDTKPFVVLDDPFVNADPDKLEKALNVLKDLSKEFQIIYLTCHPSRSI